MSTPAFCGTGVQTSGSVNAKRFLCHLGSIPARALCMLGEPSVNRASIPARETPCQTTEYKNKTKQKPCLLQEQCRLRALTTLSAELCYLCFCFYRGRLCIGQRGRVIRSESHSSRGVKCLKLAQVCLTPEAKFSRLHYPLPFPGIFVCFLCLSGAGAGTQGPAYTRQALTTELSFPSLSNWGCICTLAHSPFPDLRFLILTIISADQDRDTQGRHPRVSDSGGHCQRLSSGVLETWATARQLPLYLWFCFP